MYEIYLDDECIYDDTNSMDIFRLSSPTLELSDNAAGSLDFSMPITNIGYDKVKRYSSTVTVYKNKTEIWSGRVTNISKDFWNNKKVSCEGELSYLADTIQPQADFENCTPREFLEAIIAVHNSKAPSDKQFTVGSVTVTDKMKNEYSPYNGTDEEDYIVFTNYDSTLNCISTKLIDNLKGHIRIRKVNGIRYLDYLKDYPNVSTQDIQFGINLMDFVSEYDNENFCTVLIPLGASYGDGDVDGLNGYVDITDVNDGKNYILNQEAVNNFGWIERTHEFSDIYDDEELLTKAREYLSEIQFDSMNLDVKAFDLSNMNVEYEEWHLLDEVRVMSSPHGLDRLFPLTSITIPLDNLSQTTYSFGIKKATANLTSYSSSVSEHVENLVQNAVKDNYSILNSAKDNASALINSATNGFITITQGDNGSQELYISNTKDYTTATKKWRWNINGLGYSKDGGSKYDLAMTMDGAIVADFITTGTLSANRIRAGIITDTMGYSSWNLDSGELNLRGVFTNYSYSGYKSVELSDNMMKLFDWGGDHEQIGGLYALRNESQGYRLVGLTVDNDDDLVALGYKNGENNYDNAIWIIPSEIKNGHTPHISNTASGTMHIGDGTIEIENGFIKSWNNIGAGASGTIFGCINVSNGFITDWNTTTSSGTLVFNAGYWSINGGYSVNQLTMTFDHGIFTGAHT